MINLSSFAGYLAPAGWSYAAGKAWVLSFTDTVAASLDGTGRAGHRGRAGLGEDRLPRAQRPADGQLGAVAHARGGRRPLPRRPGARAAS